MANLFSKLKNRFSDIVSVAPGARDRYDDDDYDDYDDDYDDEYDDDYDDRYDDRYDDSGRLQLHYGGSRDAGYRRSGSRDDRASSRRGGESRYDREQPSSRRESGSSRYGGRNNERERERDVIPFGEAGRNQSPVANVESIILRPKLVDDAVEICNHMRAGRMCIVDLTGLNNANAQRIADYLGGVCHALDGVTTRVNEGIFTVAPHSHRVMSDYREEMPLDRGSFFSRAANDR